MNNHNLMDVNGQDDSKGLVEFYISEQELEEENCLFQLVFIEIMKILTNELITSILSDNEDMIFYEYERRREYKILRKQNNIDSNEIEKVLNTNWINKYQVSF
jgi:hypothetical protein